MIWDEGSGAPVVLLVAGEPFKWGLQEEGPPNLISTNENYSETGNKEQCHGFTKQPDGLQAVIYSENGRGGRAVQK